MINVYAENRNNSSKKALVDLPASDGTLQKFREELDVSSNEIMQDMGM